MDADTFHTVALSLAGATFDVKWGADRVYSVGAKMFAMAGQVGDPAPAYAFKVSDMAFELLVEQGLARPSPYLARFMWVQLTTADALGDDELRAYVAQAHGLVAAGLPRRTRRALGLEA